MRLLLQENSWSCLVASFAMVLDILPRDIYDMLGHMGDEIIYPELSDPYARRSFHIQELITCCLRLGVYPVPLDREIILCPPVDIDDNVLSQELHEPRLLTIKNHLEHYLTLRSGVLIGWINSNHHAVAWCQHEQVIFDPSGCKRPLSDMDIEIFWACF